MTTWLPIPSCPNYEASDQGEIRRIGTKNALRPAAANRPGHLRVSLWHDGIGVSHWVQRLICEAFHGPAPTARSHAAHGNGNPTDNRPNNLTWKSPVENAADKKRHGTENIGERNGGAILTDEKVKLLRLRAAELPRSSGGKRIKKGALGKIAAEFGVTRACAWQVINHHRWRHLP
jgi:hypothetical protein